MVLNLQNLQMHNHIVQQFYLALLYLTYYCYLSQNIQLYYKEKTAPKLSLNTYLKELSRYLWLNYLNMKLFFCNFPMYNCLA